MITAGLGPSASAQQDLWVPINLLGVLGAVLVLLGLPAIYVRAAEKTGLAGFLGTALIAVAWMFFGLFLSLYAVIVLPWLAIRAPALVAASAPLPAAFIHHCIHRWTDRLDHWRRAARSALHSWTRTSSMDRIPIARIRALDGNRKPGHCSKWTCQQFSDQSAFEPRTSFAGDWTWLSWLPDVVRATNLAQHLEKQKSAILAQQFDSDMSIP